VAALVVWPLAAGRFYGFGQVLIGCLLLALAVWCVHWTHRVLRVQGDRILIESPVRGRSMEAGEVRVEIRRGWWTRVVLIPSFGLPASFLRTLWDPDPESVLEAGLREDRFRREERPSLGGPGPAEEDRP
jgi:hypothetical protein